MDEQKLSHETIADPVTLSVFVPFFNEEENIEHSVNSIYTALSSNPRIASFELIIVNDGSTDSTSVLAHRLLHKYENVRVVEHAQNRGYGGALKSGFAACTMDYVFYTDGDLQFDPEEIDLLLQHISEYKVVVGYRKHRKDPFLRIVYAKCWNILVRTIFGLKLKDINCAFKLLKRDVIEDMQLISSGAMVSTELLVRVKDKQVPIKQIAVTHQNRLSGTPTGGSIGVILLAFKELITYAQKLKI